MKSILSYLKTITIAITSILGFTMNAYTQIQIGQDIDGEAAYDNSGWSVSMPDAFTIAIGARENDSNGPGTDYGHVRVFKWNGAAWIQKGSDIDGEGSGDGSGYSVSMPDANTVAIGAKGNDGSASDAGHVRIFTWNGAAWIQKGSDINGEAANDWSGSSVSMPDANTVAIGATKNDGNGTDAGHVRIYEWNGTNWIQKGIDINSEAANDSFGWSVSMPDANTVAIGAISNDGNGSSSGHTRVFQWNGTTWVQKGIDIDGEANDNESGCSVTMPDPNTVAIGAHRNDANGPGQLYGHVRVYQWSGSSWTQKGDDIDGELPYDGSGWSVSMPDANTVAIGSPSNGTSSGQVKIFKWTGTIWLQVGMDISGETFADNSGYSISMPDTSTVAIGARYNSDNGTQAGHVRVYKLKGVHGLVYNDVNENCILEELSVVEGIVGIIQPGNIVVESGANGAWYIDSLPIGNYTITYDTTTNWLATCPNPMSFTISDPDLLTMIPNFGMVNTNPCSEPNISIHMPFIRVGFSDQIIYVNTCNDITATGALNAASVVVTLDDLITVDAASISYSDLGNNTFSFDVGTLDPGECVSFNISATLSNSAILGQTLCMEAILFPLDSCVLDSIPAPTPPDFVPCTLPWDKSSISVEGECVNDSIIFTITNTGDPGNGDMDCFSPVRLYIDGVYIWLDSLQLNGGESFVYSFAGDGQTWHLEVDQHPLHPGNSNPNATVELCGNPDNWTPNLVNQFPHDDLDPINDIYCGVVTGSYDPNDKTGFPLGVGNDHLISANGKIDYVIRFQNTGTDTAFTVVIRDTLDLDLDIFSVQSGVASHAYTFQMHGPRVLEWTFNNILLPDSNVNEPASNGFVTFTVKQEPNLVDGTEINNIANIYFDFNPPIITNSTSHIIGSEIGMASWTEEYDTAFTSCDEYVYNGITYIQSGDYYQVVEGLSTDTLVNLNIAINNSTAVTDIQEACNSYLWIDGNTYTTSNSTATHTLTNIAGCDSVVTLNLTIGSPTAGTDLQSTCEPYLWIDGNTYATSNNTATHTLTNTAGCDSVVTLNLTINNPTTSNDIQTACESYLWIDGNAYTTSNFTATYTLTNAAGCDSLVTLNLTINNPNSSTDIQTACESYLWIDGNTYTASNNSATHSLTNLAGCDSIVTLNLTINNSTGIDIQTACDSYVWIDGNTYTTSNNTATHTLTNMAGCDSVVTLNLTINHVSDLTTTLSDITVTANNANASYVWLDCDNNFASISGETGQSYTPTENGNYAVVLSENGCLDTSDCVAITTVGIIENSMTDNFIIFPNPTDGMVKIVFENNQEELNVSLHSVSGQLLETIMFKNASTITFEIEGASGVYFLKLNSNDQEATIRVVKE